MTAYTTPKVPTVAAGNIQSGEPSPGTVLANPTEAECCLECIGDVVPELVGTDLNDLAGLCEPGQVTWAVCEGCGAGWFDAWGRRVAMPPDVTGILTITQAAVQAAEIAMFQLMQVAHMHKWATALNQLALLKNELAEELARTEEDLALAEDVPAAP